MDKFIDNRFQLDGLNPTEQAELALASEWLQRNLPIRVGDGFGHYWLMMLLDGAVPEQIRQFQVKGVGAPILGIGGLRAQSLGLLSVEQADPKSPFLVEIPAYILDRQNFAAEIQANYPVEALQYWWRESDHSIAFDSTVSATVQIALNLIDLTDKNAAIFAGARSK